MKDFHLDRSPFIDFGCNTGFWRLSFLFRAYISSGSERAFWVPIQCCSANLVCLFPECIANLSPFALLEFNFNGFLRFILPDTRHILQPCRKEHVGVKNRFFFCIGSLIIYSMTRYIFRLQQSTIQKNTKYWYHCQMWSNWSNLDIWFVDNFDRFFIRFSYSVHVEKESYMLGLIVSPCLTPASIVNLFVLSWSLTRCMNY